MLCITSSISYLFVMTVFQCQWLRSVMKDLIKNCYNTCKKFLIKICICVQKNKLSIKVLKLLAVDDLVIAVNKVADISPPCNPLK